MNSDTYAWHQAAWQEQDDGIYFCRGNHACSEACEWEKLMVEHCKAIVDLFAHWRGLPVPQHESGTLSE